MILQEFDVSWLQGHQTSASKDNWSKRSLWVCVHESYIVQFVLHLDDGDGVVK